MILRSMLGRPQEHLLCRLAHALRQRLRESQWGEDAAIDSWNLHRDMAMAQNYQPLKWMVFLLNMIISVAHWYHNFEPNPYAEVS